MYMHAHALHMHKTYTAHAHVHTCSAGKLECMYTYGVRKTHRRTDTRLKLAPPTSWGYQRCWCPQSHRTGTGRLSLALADQPPPLSACRDDRVLCYYTSLPPRRISPLVGSEWTYPELPARQSTKATWWDWVLTSLEILAYTSAFGWCSVAD